VVDCGGGVYADGQSRARKFSLGIKAHDARSKTKKIRSTTETEIPMKKTFQTSRDRRFARLQNSDISEDARRQSSRVSRRFDFF
jgi:vacuolar-type H+-ATPase subunit H